MDFFNLKTIHTINIDYPDVYFTPEYGKACEYSDDAEWELCKYKDLIYVYLKRPIECDNIIYYDLITPYGYSGYYYEKEETYKEFIPIFRKQAKKRNYITEVLRQNPYLNINIENYDAITSKIIFGIQINNLNGYNNYYQTLNRKIRTKYRKAIKNKYKFELLNMKKNLLKEKKFIDLYNFTMKKVNASKYYFFNKNYYNELEKIKPSYLSIIKNENDNIIGTSIIFEHNKFLHYHLSCNNGESSCITDFLLLNITEKLGKNKIFILGGGLKDNDPLFKFKKKIIN